MARLGRARQGAAGQGRARQGKEKPMDDKQFEKLKSDLEDVYNRYIELDEKYRQETGRNWIQPLRLSRRPERAQQ